MNEEATLGSALPTMCTFSGGEHCQRSRHCVQLVNFPTAWRIDLTIWAELRGRDVTEARCPSPGLMFPAGLGNVFEWWFSPQMGNLLILLHVLYPRITLGPINEFKVPRSSSYLQDLLPGVAARSTSGRRSLQVRSRYLHSQYIAIFESLSPKHRADLISTAWEIEIRCHSVILVRGGGGLC